MKLTTDKYDIVRKYTVPHFPVDNEYVEEFEGRFGELTDDTFREHFDDVEFTEWAMGAGY